MVTSWDFVHQVKSYRQLKLTRLQHCTLGAKVIAHYYPNKWSFSNLYVAKYHNIYRASDILLKKNQNFVGFSGANLWKNRPISRDFRGKKVKICRKISRFCGILVEKNSNFEGFLGAN